MKKINYLLMLISSLLLFACGESPQNYNTNTDSLTNSQSHNEDNQCYSALFEKDSASLILNPVLEGKVTGYLYIKLYKSKLMPLESEVNTGKIDGAFKGDTLYANYTFTSGTINKAVYINPIALLRRRDTLILGSGIVINYMGRSYFDKKRPIDFQKTKFHFKPVACK